MNKNNALTEIMSELGRATDKFGAFHSAHEGLAIILEEYEELKKEVFRKQSDYDMAKLRKEAKHVATMGLRFMIDLT